MLQLPQQPKTSPDDGFKLLRCCETLRDNKNLSTGLVTQGRYWDVIPQKKKPSPRQKIDTPIFGQQEQLRHSNFFTYTSNTSTAMVATLSYQFQGVNRGLR